MTSSAARRGEAATVLREKVARAAYDSAKSEHPSTRTWHELDDTVRDHWRHLADAVLALPEVAELRGQVERAGAAVDEAINDEWGIWYDHGHSPDGEVFQAFLAAGRRARAALASSSAREPDPCVWESGIHDQTNDHWCATHKAWSDDHPPTEPESAGQEVRGG